MHRTSAFSRCLVAVPLTVAVGAASVAFADTAWTNPDGGLWSDPANWSNGVPTAADTAILPALDRDGYAITLAGSRTCGQLRVEGSGLSLASGVLQAAGPASIGANGSVGSLTLAGATLSSPALSVGTDGGNGSLAVLAGSGLVGGSVTVADATSGVGTLSIDSGGFVGMVQVKLRAGATLVLEAKASTPLLMTTTSLEAGGTLAIVLDEAYEPTSQVQLVQTTTTGAFATVVLPELEGIDFELSIVPGSIALNASAPIDPITSIAIALGQEPLYLGFQTSIAITGVRASGVTEDLTDEAMLDLSAGDSNAVLFGASVIPVSAQPFTLHASVELPSGSTLSAERSVAAEGETPIAYRRVDLTSAGAPANGVLPWDSLDQPFGQTVDMTPDGRFVTFLSNATNLDVPDPLGLNVFVKDLWTGAIERVDADLPLATGAGLVVGASISDDGRFVAFTRQLAGPGATTMVWLHDRTTSTSVPVCLTPDGEVAVGLAGFAQISGDGSTIVYSAACEGLIEGVPATPDQVIAYDVATGVNSLVSLSAKGQPGNADSGRPSVSCDGRFVAFETTASNLVGGSAVQSKVVVHDRLAGTIERVDVGPAGPGNGSASEPSISCDGRFVSFTSVASNLAASDADAIRDVFVRDRTLGTTAHASPDLPGETFNAGFRRSAVSNDGAFVLYLGTGVNVFGEQPAEILRSHVATGTIDRVAVTPWGEPATTIPGQANWGRNWLSGDGQRALFLSNPEALIATSPLGVPYEFGANGLFLRSFAPESPADLTNDGLVNAADLAILLGAWGSTGSIADLDGDGTVGAGDLALLLAAWTA